MNEIFNLFNPPVDLRCNIDSIVDWSRFNFNKYWHGVENLNKEYENIDTIHNFAIGYKIECMIVECSDGQIFNRSGTGKDLITKSGIVLESKSKEIVWNNFSESRSITLLNTTRGNYKKRCNYILITDRTNMILSGFLPEAAIIQPRRDGVGNVQGKFDWHNGHHIYIRTRDLQIQ